MHARCGCMCRISGADCGDPVCQTGDLPRCGVLMEDALLGSSHQLWLGCAQSGICASLVARGDGFFDLAQEGAHAAAAGLVDVGFVGNLPDCFLGRTGVGHAFGLSNGPAS